MNQGVLLVNRISSTPTTTATTTTTTTPSSLSSATRLHITPMSPLNIQSLKNGFIERSNNGIMYKQNGCQPILIHPHVAPLPPQSILPKNHLVQIAPGSSALYTTKNTQCNGKFTEAEMRSSKELDTKFLTKIIGGHGKIDPSTSSQSATEKAIDYRNTVVRKAPGGTVQITYKNMINHHSNQTANHLNNNHNNNKANPVFILPKPVNGLIGKQQVAATSHHQNQSQQQQQQQQQQHVMVCSTQQNTPKVFPNDFTVQQNYANDSPSSLLNSVSSSIWTNKSTSVDFNHLSGETGLSITLSGDPNGLDSLAYHQEQLEHDLINSSPFSSKKQEDGLSDSTVTDLNPFNGIDIDLSCFDTEPFEMLQQFYPCSSEDGGQISTNGHLPNTSSSSNDVQDNSVVSVVESALYDQTHTTHTRQGEEEGTKMLTFDSNSLPLLPFSSRELKKIIDVSPEIVSSMGGVKIILIGSWNAKDARYQCLFGQYPVGAELIQNGVLRCYSPKHKPGTVTLSVLCDNVQLTEEVDFTFVESSEKSSSEDRMDHSEWLSISDTSFVQLLVERISFIADMVAGENGHDAHSIITSSNDTDATTNVEDKLVDICKGLMTVVVDINFDYKVEETMTVLHLASALGYIKLIQLLMNWVESNPNKIIQVEASPTSQDQFSLIPIMWSSAKGYFNTTCVLHQWAESTIETKDACGCTALALATENGHESLVEYLGRLLKKSTISRENSLNQEQFSSTPMYGNPGSISSNSTTLSNVDDSSPRTLGKTLAFIQSMLNDNVDEGNNSDDGDEDSLFSTASDFVHARQRSSTDENIASTNQHSPGSPSQNALQSPFNRQMRETAEFCEFFYKAKKIEKDFAELTLTDQEQEELYRAANVIQTAYKAYKERRNQRDQEFSSATLIQSYYRRYKQYAAFKKMQKGAVLIQNQYRAHREKAKKKGEAASLIQTNWRIYRQRKYAKKETNSAQEKNKLEQQACRKANRYLHQTTKRFSRELPEEFNSMNNNMEINFDTNS